VKGNTVKKNLATVIGLPFSVLAIALALAAIARADQQGSGSTPLPPPVTTTVMATPTPTPGANSASQSNVSGSSPGSSCLARVATRNGPPTPGPVDQWNTNSAVGWPFGWTGGGVYAVTPTTAPTVGCSR
jgi:hypothetical protein